MFAGVVATFAIGQFIEGSVLTPKLVGDRIGLHPVLVIFAVAAGGQLFGFFGILLALPAAAVLSVLFALPLKGIWQLKHSSTVWGGFLALLAFMLGIMEAWTVAAERLPGMIYTGLALAYILGLWLRSRGDD